MRHDIGRLQHAKAGSLTVTVRLGLRVAILAGFASASSQPFWAVLATLFIVAAGLSAVVCAIHREPVFGPDLTHWDEAAIYALLSRGSVLLFASGGMAG